MTDKKRKMAAVIFGSFFFMTFGYGLHSAQPGPSGEEIYGWAKVLTGFGPRRPGTEAMDQAREYIIGQLRGWGYQVTTEPIALTQYLPREWKLEVLHPEHRAIACYPMWHSGPTGPQGVEADLVYVQKAGKRILAEKEVAGKAVLASRGHRFINLLPLTSLSSSYELAQEKGAAGYITFFTNTPGNAFQLTDLGMPTAKPGSVPNTVPGFSIGKEDARYLKALLKQDEVRVSLHLQSDSRPAETWTIIAMLPGRTDDIIMVDTHYCSTFTGAVDNATGVVSALALAKYFSRKPQPEREKTLLFVFYGSHEFVDCNLGAVKFYRNHPDLAKKIVIDIGLDHLAGYPWKEYGGHLTRIRPLTPLPGMDQPRGAFISENPALYRIVIPALLKHRLIPFFVLPMSMFPNGATHNSKNPNPPEDSSTEQDSLLSYCICETAPSYNLGIAALRIMQCPLWWHTPLDTMDKFSPQQIKRAVDAHLEIMEKIDRVPAAKFRKK